MSRRLTSRGEPHRALRTPALLVVLFSTALAGCVGGPEQLSPSSDPTQEISVDFAFSDPVLVGTGGDAETSLFVADDGQTILACAHGGFRKPSPMWASVDGGLTFTEHFPGTNPVVSGDCDVAVLADGSWVMIYDTIASTTVAVSRDAGATWSLNFVAALPAGGVDRPWILPVADDILLTYANVMAVEPALNFFTRSTDHGTTFPVHTLINRAEPPAKTHSIMGHMIASDDGSTILVPLARVDLYDDGPYHIDLAASRDAGQTWTIEPVVGAFESSFVLPVISRAGDGTLWTSYSETLDTGASVQARYSTDDGATWSQPIVIAEDVRFPGVRAPWIDTRSDGSATVAWLHDSGDGGPGWEVWAARLDAAGVKWVAQMTEPVAEQQIFEFLMLRHGPDDRAHILYPMAGQGCEDDPASGRSRQCVWLLSEAA